MGEASTWLTEQQSHGDHEYRRFWRRAVVTGETTIRLSLADWAPDDPVDLRPSPVAIEVADLPGVNQRAFRFLVQSDVPVTLNLPSHPQHYSAAFDANGAPALVGLSSASGAQARCTVHLPDQSIVKVDQAVAEFSTGRKLTVYAANSRLQFGDESSAVVVAEGHLLLAPGRLEALHVVDGATLHIEDGSLHVESLHAAATVKIVNPDDGRRGKLLVQRVVAKGKVAIHLTAKSTAVVCEANTLSVSGLGTFVIERGAAIADLTLAVGTLDLEGDADVVGHVRGSCGQLQLGPHARLAIRGENESFTVLKSVAANATSIVEGISLPMEILDAIAVLDSLQEAQDVVIPLGSYRIPGPKLFQRQMLDDTLKKRAERIERVIDAGERLAQRRCHDGATRTRWHMQKLVVHRALARSGTDRRFYTARLWVGDAHALGQAFWLWVAGVVISWPFFVLALNKGFAPNFDSWDAWRNFAQAGALAVFSVFKLVQVAGTDGSGLPSPQWWAVVMKLVMTLLLANLIAAVVRRVRWVSHQPDEEPNI